MKITFVPAFLYIYTSLILAKPFSDERGFNSERIPCPESNEESDYTRNNINSDLMKSRPRLESPEIISSEGSNFNQKRSLSGDLTDSQNLEKRQVGVVYRDDKPIGILQPYQRSYRFIPVKEENAFESEMNLQDFSSNNAAVNKRAVNLDLMEDSYPSILANFKIDNKLDKKRNYDALTDSNIQDLKSTIRKLRSNSNNEQFEEQLKNILDDMGLIEDDDLHANKREISENDDDDEVEEDDRTTNERGKREDPCPNNEKPADQNAVTGNNLMTIEEKNEVKNDPVRVFNSGKREDSEPLEENLRKKRQKEINNNVKQGSELVEDLKDSGDLMISGNKSPLAASSEVINARDLSATDNDEDNEKRVVRDIQDKINNLKEEVKRQIESLKNQKNDNDERRKKRQTFQSLADEESPAVDPVMNPSDSEMKPLIRKRRAADLPEINYSFVRKRRGKEQVPDLHGNKRNDDEEGGELLGEDDSHESSNKKRNIFSDDDTDYYRSKRSQFPRNSDFYDQYESNDDVYDEVGDRFKRGSFENNGELYQQEANNRFLPVKSRSVRFRRTINDDQEGRPQQLSDMSDLDLFGALPKSYDGELSRFKRVKRKYGNKKVL